MKRSCIFGHIIQPPIIFVVKFVWWILQVSCSAWRLLLVCLFVCLFAQNFCVFPCNHLSDRDKIFNIAANTHVECFNDNYDVIGHLVWQPCWKNRKNLDLCISETAPKKKLKLGKWQVPLPWNKCDFWRCHRCLPYDVIIAYVERHIRSVWKFWRVI